METIAFVGAGALLLLASMGVVAARTPLRAALALIFAQLQLAILYVALDAPFVAAMQVLVYAGAVMVLFVFVIMLLNLGAQPPGAQTLTLPKVVGAAAATGVLLFVGQHALVATNPGMMPQLMGHVSAVGEVLLGRFLFAFEAVSLLLLVSVVGAIVLGLKRLSS